MDNLSLQLHPLEVNHLPPFPGQLSCLLKKIAISTGHTLQKHTLLGVEGGQGTVKFPHGPTLSLSKQFELSNTKLSLHFMSKQARTVSCIGSAEIDLGCLPQQPVVRYACPLTNSTHPQASLLVQLKRNETRVPPKVARKKPEEMNILFTESQLKEELINRRRKDPNIPTAYEISRKNYKHSQISREDPSYNSRSRSRNPPQPSSSGVSPSKIFTPSHHRSTTSYNQRYGGKTKPKIICEDSPIPREKTPEPIGPTVSRKQKAEESTWGLKQEGSGESHQQPSRLQVQPYQECSSVNSDRACFESAAREHWEGQPRGQFLSKESSEFSMRQDKYLDLTEKLQTIQDQLMGFQAKRFRTDSAQHERHQHEEQKQYRFMEQREKPPTQSEPPTNTPSPHSYPQQNITTSPTIQQQRQFALPNQQGEEEPTTFRQQFPSERQELPLMKQFPPLKEQQFPSEKQELPPKLLKQSIEVQSGRQVEGQEMRGQQLRRRFDQQLSFLQSQNQQLTKQNELLKVNSLEAEATLRKLMSQLEEEVKIKGEKQDEIDTLRRVNLEQEKEMEKQRKLLDKMGLQYEDKLDELTLLQQQLASRDHPQVQKQKQTDRQGERKEETEWRKKALEAQGSLRIRENQIRHLKLEMDNLRAEKRQLEMEVEALASNDRQEMARQQSLAHIKQVSSNSLVSITQRENETLRVEVTILQDKLTSLNLMLQGLLERGSPGREKRVEVEAVDRSREWQERTKLLELRCSALQEELRVKKSLMAEMVNLIWSQGDASLMQSIQTFMNEQRTN